MTNYPYYIVVCFDGGLLKKMTNTHKFRTLTDAINGVKARLKKSPDFIERNQVMIIEYTMQYKGKIITLYNYGEAIFINEPIEK